MAISPELQRLGLLSGGRQARQPAQAAQPVPGEGEVQSEQSLLSQIGGGTMSALGSVGNVLDLPGSMVRDILVWDNPFDQLMTPTSDKNRATGRDVLARNVLTSPFFTPNKETGMSGWVDDPAEGFQDIAGFALEMAMDPLAWLTAGTSKLPKVATQAATKSKGIFGAIDAVGGAINKVDPGMYVGRAVNRLTGFDKNTKNLWSKVAKTVGQTRPGKVVAEAAHKARRMGRQSFNYRYGDAVTDATQEAALSATGVREALDQEWLEQVVPVIDEVWNFAQGVEDMDPLEFVNMTGKSIRDAMEAKEDAVEALLSSLPGSLPESVGRLRGYKDQILDRAKGSGIRIDALEDQMVEWVHREMSEIIKTHLGGGIGGSGGGPQAISARRHQGLRKQIFKDSKTNAIDSALSDSKAHRMFDEAAEAGDESTVVNKVAEYLEGKYAGSISRNVKLMDDEAKQFKMLSINDGEEVFRNSNDLGKMTKGKGKDGQEVFRAFDEDGIILDEFEHVMGNRFELLAEHMQDMPIYKETGGLFGNVYTDLQKGFQAASRSIANAESTVDVLSKGVQSKILTAAPGRRTVTKVKPTLLRNLLDDSSFAVLDPAQLYDKLADNNPDLVKAWTAALGEGEELDLAKHFGGMQIDAEVAADFKRVWEFNGARPQDAGIKGVASNAFRSMTALFKAGVLTHPGRYERDVVTGQIQNAIEGMYSMTSARAAKRALFSEADELLLEIPEVVAYMGKHGLEPNAENATKAVRQMYASRRGHAASKQRDLDNTSTALDAGNDVGTMMGVLPGTGQTGIWDLIKEVGATAVGRRREPGTGLLDAYFNPHGIAGFNQSKRTTQPLVQAGDIVGKHADDWNRLTGFIELMRKGDSADDAMKAVNRVQLNYDPRTFTPTEQQLKKIFPFYSFMSRELGYVGSTLLNDPAGRLGQLIRLGRHQQDEDTFLPEHVKKSGAVPWGEVQEDGTQNYVTGLGLMFEDTLTQIAPSSSSEFFRDIISQTNPMIKAPVEWAFGQSSFQGDSMGGRDLHDMDPIIGRTLTNIGLQAPMPNERASPVGGSLATEFVVANSPASRILGNFRTATDSRKNVMAKAINLLTGMRITSVSPEKQRQGVRGIADARARELGASVFETIQISDELIEAAGEGTKAQAELRSTKLLRAIWAEQDRKKKRLGDYEKGLPHTKAQKTKHKEAVVRGIKPGTADYQNYVFGGKLSDLLKEAQGN